MRLLKPLSESELENKVKIYPQIVIRTGSEKINLEASYFALRCFKYREFCEVIAGYTVLNDEETRTLREGLRDHHDGTIEKIKHYSLENGTPVVREEAVLARFLGVQYWVDKKKEGIVQKYRRDSP